MIDLKTWNVVIWGYQYDNHSHHWIHAGYYKAFQHLGANVCWLSNESTELPDLSKNTLFISEHQVDEQIPISKDNFYVIHNRGSGGKYQDVPMLSTQTFINDDLKYKWEKLDDCIYFDSEGHGLHYIWATDLLPHEIIKPTELNVCQGNVVHWVGTAGGAGTRFGNEDQLNDFGRACYEKGIKFKWHGLWAKDNSCPVSIEDNIRLIRDSYMAPAIVGKWQQEVGYVPCRIFKNISYGQLGLTNSATVYHLFQDKIVYNPDCYELFWDAELAFSFAELEDLHWQMDFVAQKHTYLNRIQTLLDCSNRILEGV